MASEIKVDTVSEKTSANGVTIDGVNIKDSVVTGATNITLSGELDAATLGITTAKDLGTGIHIRTADSGGSVLSYADELVIEGGAAGTGMTILCQNDQSGSIMFGDQDDNDVGFVQYSHGSDYLRFISNAVESLRTYWWKIINRWGRIPRYRCGRSLFRPKCFR